LKPYQSLKTTAQTVLTSRSAMWMDWGLGRAFSCNDACLPTLETGDKPVLGSGQANCKPTGTRPCRCTFAYSPLAPTARWPPAGAGVFHLLGPAPACREQPVGDGI